MKHTSTSFFPLIVLALTLILVSSFVFLSSPKQTEQKRVSLQTSVITETQYQEALSAVLKKFFTVYDSATTDVVRAETVQNTLNALLSMRVPAGFKDLHLELAIAFQKMKQGFVSNPQDVTEGYEQVKTLSSQTSWLHL